MKKKSYTLTIEELDAQIAEQHRVFKPIPLDQLTAAITNHMPLTTPMDSNEKSLHFLLYEILIEHGYSTPEIMEMGKDLYFAASLIDY